MKKTLCYLMVTLLVMSIPMVGLAAQYYQSKNVNKTVNVRDLSTGFDTNESVVALTLQQTFDVLSNSTGITGYNFLSEYLVKGPCGKSSSFSGSNTFSTYSYTNATTGLKELKITTNWISVGGQWSVTAIKYSTSAQPQAYTYGTAYNTFSGEAHTIVKTYTK